MSIIRISFFKYKKTVLPLSLLFFTLSSYEFYVRSHPLDIDSAAFTLTEKNLILIERTYLRDGHCEKVFIGTSVTTNMGKFLQQEGVCNLSLSGQGLYSILEIIKELKINPSSYYIDLNTLLQDDWKLREIKYSFLEIKLLKHIHFLRKENNLLIRLLNRPEGHTFLEKKHSESFHLGNYFTEQLPSSPSIMKRILKKQQEALLKLLSQTENPKIHITLLHLNMLDKPPFLENFFSGLKTDLKNQNHIVRSISISPNDTTDGVHLRKERMGIYEKSLKDIFRKTL